MGTVIVACQTLRDELALAVKETGVNFPVIYIESGLHNTPELLHKRIQEEINRLDNVEVILLLFGYCGNSLLGIKSANAKLVLPKVDDCIPLLLGSCAVRKEISKKMGTYFLTQGWLNFENNLIKEYERCVERYGQARTAKIMKIMLGHYKRFMLIDTGAYPVERILPKIQKFAEHLHMCHEVVPGSLRLFLKLLRGEWDEEFLVVEPGKEIRLNDICGDCNESQAAMLFLQN
ncbi:DUF1638 domain-containing protein [Sporomusa acidovorans]|uniref:DUF1638 domain-containing protein n=1 Tax=Sporomusa acidovorans (strain ATCC 49682 / DSM 3132 / Mol) TaxID=1123286 RepID=A0ABZ3J4I5_SPOA4|nr:DUF1638 domain-containing protein [Sporomusa acidovorans]OZC16355.1 hypothetical protein SPACI_42530 [Sporomusa acidovorans DSM 3132]SDF01094.1 Protein of unknown function [Sporomusa acidovorans]